AVDALSLDSSDAALHNVRIHAKRLRYAAEAAAHVVGAPARRMARATARVQDVLGDFNDACVAEAWLRDQVAGGTAARNVVVGQLIALERQKQQRSREGWRSAWRALRRPSLRRWLRA